MRIKKFLAMLGCTAVLVSSCVYFSSSSLAASGNSDTLPGYELHAYSTTKTKKIDIGEGVVIERSSNPNDEICNICGAWLDFCVKNSIEFENSGAYYSEVNIKNGLGSRLHFKYHIMVLNDKRFIYSWGGGIPVTTTVHLKTTQYQDTQIQYLKNGQLIDVAD